MGEKELDNQRRLVAECWSGGGSSVVIGPLPSTSCPDALAVVCHERFLSHFLSLSPSLPPSSGHKDWCASLHEVQKCIHAPFT